MRWAPALSSFKSASPFVGFFFLVVIRFPTNLRSLRSSNPACFFFFFFFFCDGGGTAEWGVHQCSTMHKVIPPKRRRAMP